VSDGCDVSRTGGRPGPLFGSDNTPGPLQCAKASGFSLKLRVSKETGEPLLIHAHQCAMQGPFPASHGWHRDMKVAQGRL